MRNSLTSLSRFPSVWRNALLCTSSQTGETPLPGRSRLVGRFRELGTVPLLSRLLHSPSHDLHSASHREHAGTATLKLLSQFDWSWNRFACRNHRLLRLHAKRSADSIGCGAARKGCAAKTRG